MCCQAVPSDDPPVDEHGRPLIVKSGTIDVDLVETTPIVVQDKLYRFEYVRIGYWNNQTGESYFRFVDRETGMTTKAFAQGFHLGSAFVHEGIIYVTAVDIWDGEQIHIFSSKDLDNWDSWMAFELPGYGIFNTSLTRAENKFVLMFEIGKPKEKAGERFTANFAFSTNLKNWNILSSDHNYAKDRYTAPHCLRYHNGYYYNFYLEAHNGYEMRVVRSKDLKNWEPSPLNPVLSFSEADKNIANDMLSSALRKRIKKAENRNNSDIDFCEYNGNLIINYSWGNQRGEEFLAEATYAGTMVEFLQGWYPEDYYPHPENNPQSPVMLKGAWVPDNPHDIDFNLLPRIKSQHVVVSDVNAVDGVNQHNYLAYHHGKYWLMWSDGPGVEDRVGQRVAFATSIDGLSWSEKQFITPYPPKSGPDSDDFNRRSTNGFRYISRGFWQRDGELLALVSLDEADGFFGESLELRAFRYDPNPNAWKDAGLVFDNTINNFPPKLLPNGEWMMTRRSFDRDVYMLTGGIDGVDQWENHPVVRMGESELMPEEPYWWVLPDGKLLALFRDNAKSGFLYRAFSTDMGRSWTRPARTDFPDARSKFNGLQLSDGRYILVSNPNPEKRDPLALSISDDGMVFDKMGYLFGGRRIDYPHVIEHDGYLLIAFSGGKQSIEILKIRLDELNKLRMPLEPISK